MWITFVRPGTGCRQRSVVTEPARMDPLEVTHLSRLARNRLQAVIGHPAPDPQRMRPYRLDRMIEDRLDIHVE